MNGQENSAGFGYNVRYPGAALQEFNAWLENQASSRGLHCVDLHDLLPPEEFVDSMHVGASGHAKIAEHLAVDLKPLLTNLVKRKTR